MSAGSFGWVCEGDRAPCFELPDSKFTSVSPIGANTKVRGWGLPCVSNLPPSVKTLYKIRTRYMFPFDRMQQIEKLARVPQDIRTASTSYLRERISNEEKARQQETGARAVRDGAGSGRCFYVNRPRALDYIVCSCTAPTRDTYVHVYNGTKAPYMPLLIGCIIGLSYVECYVRCGNPCNAYQRPLLKY